MTLNILGVLTNYLESHDPMLLPILADALEEDGRMEDAAWCRNDVRIINGKEWALEFGLRAANYAPGWWYQEKMGGQWIGQTGGTEADARRELARRVREQLTVFCCPGAKDAEQQCPLCQGRGWLLKPQQATCPECKGSKQINTGPGDYGDEYVPCNRCHGTGTVEG